MENVWRASVQWMSPTVGASEDPFNGDLEFTGVNKVWSGSITNLDTKEVCGIGIWRDPATLKWQVGLSRRPR